MLDDITKRRINSARDILVGKLPDPKSQVEQITIALIYKFMDDMDRQAEALPRGKAKFFTGEFRKHAWRNIFSPQMGGHDVVALYGEAIQTMNQNPSVPQLFRDIFKNAYLPYRDPETLKSFLKEINEFEYDHSERLGDAFEYLLSVLGSQGDAGQFRTPRNIIDFMVEILEPKKNEKILDPACGTAGFLISAYKHIIKHNSKNYDPSNDPKPFELQNIKLSELTVNGKGYRGEKLTSDDRKRLVENISGYDISPDMVRLSLVNMYLHGFSNPKIYEYDTLSRDDKWDEKAEVILANPPFMSPKGGIKPHTRFSVQSNRSEVLFVDYMAEHLTSQGRAAIIVPEGVVFQTGTAYVQLRKMLVEEYLVGVISLPAGLFNPYSGVKTSVLWLDKQLAKKTRNILFVKIENDGYDLGAQRRPIKENDLPNAYRAIIEYKEKLITGKDLKENAWKNIRIVEKNKIAKDGDYGLSGERYVINKGSSLTKWPMVSLGDAKLFQIESGGTPDSQKPNYWNGDINWATLVDLPQEDIITELHHTRRRITSEGLKNSSAKLLPEKTVLVSSRATIGRIAIVRKESATNQGFKNILIKDFSMVNEKYLAYMMINLVDKMNSLASGGTFKEISKTLFSTMQIPLPPLSIQGEIVAELDSYQKIVSGARQVVESYRPHIDIDPKWPVVKLESVCLPEYGFTETAKEAGDARLIRITDIDDAGKLRTEGEKYVSLTREARSYVLKHDDVLVARTGATYGKTVIFKENYPAVFASFLIRLNFDRSKVDPNYYWAFAQSNNYWNQAQRLVTGGGQPQFNGGAIKQIEIPLPPLSIQSKIANEIQIEGETILSNKRLIVIFKQRINTLIKKTWGEK